MLLVLRVRILSIAYQIVGFKIPIFPGYLYVHTAFSTQKTNIDFST
jgi:hypothetical protein